LQGLAQQIVQQGAATATAQAQLTSAQQRMDHGLGNHAGVLSAQAALLRQRDADLYLQQAQLLAEVALTHALGGGYHEEAPLATAAK
jgi:multidrug efflux system outer membrane protein